ncbi:MAG: transglutaminase-like domain-containing protein [Pirellulaceae bacterium]
MAAEQRQFSPRELFEKSVGQNVQLSEDDALIELERGQLFEDDGPGAGYSYQPNEETLGPAVQVRKELLIPDPRASRAILLVGPGGELQARINGQQQDLRLEGKAGNYWQRYSFPPDVLRPGKNEFVLSGSGKIWIARDEDFAAGSRHRTRHPNRSTRSTDGGATWDNKRLGTQGNVDGEYYVRVFLDQYRSRGTLTLPVIDAGNLEGKLVSPPVASLGPVRVGIESEAGNAGQLDTYFRTSTTMAIADRGWSDWQPLGEGGIVAQPAGRFIQVKVGFTTDNPLHSPRLRRITVEANPERGDAWVSRLRTVDAENDKIVRSSIPFEYEPLDHPHLAELRQRYQLDQVIAGADQEFEQITRLAAWASRQWSRGHLGEAYPPWDALEILSQHRDGTPIGGFCQQYNLVFLQACESLGLIGRAVSLSPGSLVDKPRRSGHEVVEIWSNDYRKWVYVDGQFAWYAVDRETGIPLSLWELRQRQLATFSDRPIESTRIVTIAETDRKWSSVGEEVPFAELRLIPRSNFLQQQHPVPLNQGMRGWFWTGHYVWTDDLLPAAMLYGNRVTRRGDFEWTVNQVHLALEATSTPGELRVHLDTHTPGLEAFVVQIDDQETRDEQAVFLWKLHKGRNRLEVKTRNIAGREGPASWIVLDNE